MGPVVPGPFESFFKPQFIILCLGVLKYGVGTWEEAKADLELELNSKILPTSDDATPQVNSFSIRKPAF